MRDKNQPTVVSGHLNSLGTREETAVDGIHDGLRGDLFASKETSIEAFDSVLAALNTVELQVNVALRVRIYRDVNNMAIFLFALLADVILQILDPSFTGFSVKKLSVVEFQHGEKEKQEQGPGGIDVLTR